MQAHADARIYYLKNSVVNYSSIHHILLPLPIRKRRWHYAVEYCCDVANLQWTWSPNFGACYKVIKTLELDTSTVLPRLRPVLCRSYPFKRYSPLRSSSYNLILRPFPPCLPLYKSCAPSTNHLLHSLHDPESSSLNLYFLPLRPLI